MDFTSMVVQPRELQTARLRMRPPREVGAEAIYAGNAQDERVASYAIWSPPSSIEITLEFMRRRIKVWEEKSAYPWAINRIRDNCLLGTVEIRIQRHKADLGTMIAWPDWSKGYAAEEVQSVVKWAIEQPRIMRVCVHCATLITNLTHITTRAACQGFNI